MSDSPFRPVTKSGPCAICSKDHWCRRSDDGAHECHRVNEPSVHGFQRITTTPAGFAVYRRPEHRSSPPPKTPPPPPKSPPRVFATPGAAAQTFAGWKKGTVESIYQWTNDWYRARIRTGDGKQFCEITRTEGGWVQRGPLKPHPLYRHAELPADGPIFVCEGEKACDAGWSIGLPCTTSGSADSAGSADWRPLFDREVIHLPDHDEPGARYASQVSKRLHESNSPARVKIMELPGLGPGDDLHEFVHELRDGQDAEEIKSEILALVARTPEWKDVPAPARPSDARTDPEWESPAPLAMHNLPSFPADAIPPALNVFRKFCAAVSDAYQVPMDLPALLALATGAAALAKRVRVHVRANHFEPVNIYSVIALPPGDRKSAVCHAIAEPIVEFEADECRRLAEEIEANSRERRMLAKRIEHLESKYAKSAKGDLSGEVKAEIEEIAAKLRGMPESIAPRYLADDASPEALSRLLYLHAGRIAVISPEGGELFDLMAGPYAKAGTTNLGVYLKAHAGDDLRVDRVNKDRPPEFVRSPALTLGLAIQPDVLRGLASKPGFRGRGLLGRFLYSLPVSRLGNRRVDAPGVPPAISQAYDAMIRTSLELACPVIDGRERPFVLRFTPSALSELMAFQAEIELRLREGRDLSTIRDWGGKLVGLVARIAGVYHGLMYAATGDPQTAQIDQEILRAAISLGRYAAAHAKAAYGEMGADAAVELARRLLRWIDGQQQFKRRDAFMALRPGVEKVTEIDAPLDLLVQHGYIREESQSRNGPGRRPSQVYTVNPLAHNAQKAHNSDPPSDSAHCAHSALEPQSESDAPDSQ